MTLPPADLSAVPSDPLASLSWFTARMAEAQPLSPPVPSPLVTHLPLIHALICLLTPARIVLIAPEESAVGDFLYTTAAEQRLNVQILRHAPADNRPLPAGGGMILVDHLTTAAQRQNWAAQSGAEALLWAGAIEGDAYLLAQSSGGGVALHLTGSPPRLLESILTSPHVRATLDVICATLGEGLRARAQDHTQVQAEQRLRDMAQARLRAQLESAIQAAQQSVRLQAELERLSQRLLLTHPDHTELRAQLSQVSEQLADLRSSTSWRITRPLRALARKLRRG